VCIAYLALYAHPDWPVFIAANRDEFHQRPARAAAPWPNRPDIVSGLDLQAGGTWMGVTTSGRFALVTNYREPGAVLDPVPDRSRGALVADFLSATASASDYLAAIPAKRYQGFNLIVGDGACAYYLSNRDPHSPRALAPGRYALSNHLLDTPWPKVERLRQALAPYPSDALRQSLQPVFDALADATPARDAQLPDTGLPLARERMLSSVFIQSPDYGTRCSTVLAMRADGWGIFSEQSFNAQGVGVMRHDWPLTLCDHASASRNCV